MDLRTKLVFTLVGVSLVSMLVLGWLAYSNAEDLLTERARSQLGSLAEAKKEDLETVVHGWRDRVALLTSRTQLRLSLQAFNETGDEAERQRIQRILRDVTRASAAVEAVAVYGVGGQAVAAVGIDDGPEATPPLPTPPREMADSVVFLGLTRPGEEPALVRFLAPLDLEGTRVGVLRASLSSADLAELTGNVTGLGETGQVLIGIPDSTGDVHVLGPGVRRTGVTRDGLEGEEAWEPLRRALAGQEDAFTAGLVDEEGEAVWAATRFLPELGWGLAVSFDADEERAEIVEFRERLVGVGFSLAAFAVLLGTLLGLAYARPIHELAEVANRLREGEMDARVVVTREDELGLLASTFNEMGDELERRMTLLQEFKRFFNLSPDILCIAGTDGYFKRVNPAFERTVGWTEAELVGRPFVEYVHPEDVESTLRETERLRQGIPTVSFSNRYRRADGTYTRLSWTCHPDEDSGLLYAIARDEGPPERGEPHEA